MTFKLSPGIYFTHKDIDTSSYTYSDNPTVMVGSFKKGSLSPTRIIRGENDSLYDLSNSNLKYGYSTIIANQASEGNNLIIKRVVSNSARTAEVSLMRSKNVKDYTTLKVDLDGNVLTPYAIFFDNSLQEDYGLTVSFVISGNYGSIKESTKYATSHNDAVKELISKLQSSLDTTGLHFIIDYNTYQNPIKAIYIYPPFGFSLLNGEAKVFLDLVPLTLEQKATILDECINGHIIAIEDRPTLLVQLDQNVFYKKVEVIEWLKSWAKNHYLSINQVKDRVSYYLTNKWIDANAVNAFYNWLDGRQYTTKNFDDLDALCMQFKEVYYLSEQQIRDIINKSVEVIITQQDVEVVIRDIFVPDNWLYTTEQQVTQTLNNWAERNLVSTASKRQWIQQYIYQAKIRQEDFDDAFSYVSIPIDNILNLQKTLDEYCEKTYMTTEEKEHIVQTFVDSGELTEEQGKQVLNLLSYLIRKDQSYLVQEYINVFLQNVKLSIDDITVWVNQQITNGWLLSKDRDDFLDYLKNDELLTYNYKSYSELQLKLDSYIADHYLTKTQAETYINGFVNIKITQEDATYILNEITTNVIEKSTVDSEIQKLSEKYFSETEILAYIAISNVKENDIPTVLALFNGVLISKEEPEKVTAIIDNWKNDNYMNEQEIKQIVSQYNQSQNTNPVLIRNEETDFHDFYDSIHSNIYEKNDSASITFALQNWSASYYLTQEAILEVWNQQVESGTAYGDINVWKNSSYYSVGGLYKTTNEVVNDIVAWETDQIEDVIKSNLANYSGYDYDIRVAIQLNVFIGHDPAGVESDWSYKTDLLVQSYDANGPVFRNFDSLNSAITMLDSYSMTYQNYSTILNTIQNVTDYSKLSGEQKTLLENQMIYGADNPPNPENHIRVVYYIPKTDEETGVVDPDQCDARAKELMQQFYKTVTFNVTPSDAIVKIDNVETKTATGIEDYPYHYEVSKEGYIPQSGDLGFKNETIDITLEAEPTT